jgi:4-hydroxyphenylpyruvate dioxygenase
MSIKLAISSHSLGRAGFHGLANKLDEAAKYGYEGIEAFFEDIETIATSYAGGSTPENQIRAAHYVRKLCDERNLTIIALQPFLFYEGILDDEQHRQKIEKLHLWFKLAHALGTDMIQIPSNFSVDEPFGGDRDRIVKDLVEIADLGLKESPVVRFAYEGMAWAPYVSLWEDVWDMVKLVDRPNFGCLMDTFHIAAKVWADPSSASGRRRNAEKDLKESLEHLVKEIDVKKLYYIQVADAEFMDPPIGDSHPWALEAGQPSSLTWSRNARLFAFEEGGYLPILQITKALVEGLGYKGWISLELYSRSMADPSPNVPHEHAKRGRLSWDKLTEALNVS